MVNVSTISLSNQLFDGEGMYQSNLARRVDESIFFYVEDAEINYSDERLITLLNEQTGLA